ncbi:hypothetical protein Scep_028577 [Stephania cephalantha]|uniref:Major facilitator superfamily (MFS) profile domain-containing protein n=1 Tax=Stephania cephalantha TaxID=152367 RepID=A0AAP0ECB0_9MAGN
MAGGGVMVSQGKPGKKYPGGMTLSVFIACMIAAFGGLIFGYDIGISGGVTSMAPFLQKFFPDVYKKEKGMQSTNQYCKFDSHKLTMFTSSLYLAALVASFFASTVTRVFGRRSSMFVGGAVFLAGSIVNAISKNVIMLIIGRVLLGVGVGFANQSVPLYLSEMAPYKYRGALNIGFQLMITFGILAANLVNYFTAKIEGGWGWRVSLGGAAVPALMIGIGSFFVPDTPNSILERNKPEKAKEMLKKIRGTDNVDDEFDDICAAGEASRLVKHPWANIWKRKYRPQLVFAVLFPFFQQLTGMNVVMFYAPVLFKTLGFGDNASLLSSVITGTVNSIATFVSIAAVDKVGRKALLIEGGLQMGIFQVFIGSIIWKKFGFDGVAAIDSLSAKLVVIGICSFVVAFAWSWGPLGWLVPSEIFPLEIRSAAQSINVAVNMLFTFFIAEIFLKMLCTFKFGLFFFFAFWVFIATFVIWKFLPETKGIPIEEMSKVWRSHWYWKKFVVDGDGDEGVDSEKKPQDTC